MSYSEQLSFSTHEHNFNRTKVGKHNNCSLGIIRLNVSPVTISVFWFHLNTDQLIEEDKIDSMALLRKKTKCWRKTKKDHFLAKSLKRPKQCSQILRRPENSEKETKRRPLFSWKGDQKETNFWQKGDLLYWYKVLRV